MRMTSSLDVLEKGLDLQIGEIRSFGNKDIAERGLVRGWAIPEATHNWNDGPEAVLRLTTLRPDFRCVLVVEGAPLSSPAVTRQDVTLYGNGLRLGYWRLTGAADVQLEVLLEPSHWLVKDKVGRMELAFHLPDSLRLSTVLAEGDDRELGFCFRTIALFSTSHGR